MKFPMYGKMKFMATKPPTSCCLSLYLAVQNPHSCRETPHFYPFFLFFLLLRPSEAIQKLRIYSKYECQFQWGKHSQFHPPPPQLGHAGALPPHWVGSRTSAAFLLRPGPLRSEAMGKTRENSAGLLGIFAWNSYESSQIHGGFHHQKRLRSFFSWDFGSNIGKKSWEIMRYRDHWSTFFSPSKWWWCWSIPGRLGMEKIWAPGIPMNDIPFRWLDQDRVISALHLERISTCQLSSGGRVCWFLYLTGVYIKLRFI